MLSTLVFIWSAACKGAALQAYCFIAAARVAAFFRSNIL
jgi:hypothetical protein